MFPTILALLTYFDKPYTDSAHVSAFQRLEFLLETSPERKSLVDLCDLAIGDGEET
jgi:hypothetical protein